MAMKMNTATSMQQWMNQAQNRRRVSWQEGGHGHPEQAVRHPIKMQDPKEGC